MPDWQMRDGFGVIGKAQVHRYPCAAILVWLGAFPPRNATASLAAVKAYLGLIAGIDGCFTLCRDPFINPIISP
jgi:hypothetical protein